MLSEHDRLHPIFGSRTLGEFIGHWDGLDRIYNPNGGESLRILSAIQEQRLARVSCGCKDGREGSVWDVVGDKIQVDLDGTPGIYNPIMEKVSFLGVRAPRDH